MRKIIHTKIIGDGSLSNLPESNNEVNINVWIWLSCGWVFATFFALINANFMLKNVAELTCFVHRVY